MTADAKPRNVEDSDAAVQAFLPDPNENQRLFNIITKNMIHKSGESGNTMCGGDKEKAVRRATNRDTTLTA
ncbi:hypothetical protein OESDEN_01928 [Oesophagostomum dentatum]|uniref:Uncharacterized protein n=1 Tax=Oesophagostomum dentatum TaxID=61180 RepID=A0A0B1TRT1_OESDE|nr:hypothetical protein OESDEN_01928 [Oesophagostomum dentatum]